MCAEDQTPPPPTFSASVNSILYLDAKPVSIDSERASWNMDPDLLAATLGPQGKAGPAPQSRDPGPPLRPERGHRSHPRSLQPLRRSSDRGRGRGPGRDLQGPLAGHLFLQRQQDHATSGGGMLVSNDAELIAHARKLATQARDPAPHYQHSEIGYNYRLSNILAGVGRGQLHPLVDSDHGRSRALWRHP